MSYFRTGDPLADFHRKDAEESAWLESLPKCDYCGKHIYDHYYEVNCDIICPLCMDYLFRKEVDMDE